MTSKQQQIPAVRFKGFTDAWEQRELKNISKIFIGLVTTMTENYRDSGTLLIRNSDIKENRFEFSENPIHLDEQFAEANNSRRLKYGDVVTVHTGDIGTSAVIDENEVGAIGFATINTRPNPEVLDSKYLAAYFNTPVHKNYATKMATGDGRSNYNLKDFTKLVIPVTSLKEQEKIGALLKCLEGTIALHQRQLDNYKKLKKVMMQKIFDQELRFKDQDGNNYPDWREATLGEICLYKSSSISLDSFKEYKGEKIYPLYDANSLVLNIDKYDQENDYVSIIKDGAGAGRIRYCEGKSSVLGTMGYLLPINTVDIQFLYFRLQIINFSSYISGSTIPHIYFKDYKKENIGLPCEDEQKKISHFLSTLEKNVENSKKAIESLKQQKKGLMLLMFA